MLTTIGLRQRDLVPFKDFNSRFLVLSPRLYDYRPLESSTHIRILHLRDGGDGEPLCCKIEHVNLDFAKRLSYEAISYVWGRPNKPFWINLDDGSRIPLTTSLHDALRDLRGVCKTGTNIFWADAICINQADIREHSKQVRLIGRIYSSASRVITYIGPASWIDYSGIDLARKILNYAESHRGEPPDLRILVRAFHNQVGFPASQDPQWEALRSLLRREWSARAWMVQEFLLNKELFMLCGRQFLPWNTFPQLPRLAADGKVPGGFVVGFMEGTTILDNLSVLDVLRTARQENPDFNITMLELLQWCHVMSSTDARDKIYAVLGLACDRDQLGIIPDYSVSTAQVYRDTAVCILETHPTLDILSSAHANKSMELPSWVPDWSFWSEDIPVPLVHDATFSRPCFYDACTGAKSKIKFNAQNSEVTVQGVVMDHISFSSGRLGFFSLDPADNFCEFQHLLRELHSWRESLSQARADEVLWRTLITNIVYEQREPSSEVGRWFLAYMGLMEWNAAFRRGETHILVSPLVMNLAHKFLIAMCAKAERQSICMTEKGYLCLAPPDAKVGDSLCILLGGRVPYILRRRGESVYSLVGESYVHGLMKGEAFKNEASKEHIKDTVTGEIGFSRKINVFKLNSRFWTH